VGWINIITKLRTNKVMPPKKEILPAIIAQNQEELDQMLKRIPFADNVMLDLMDGKFVGSTSLDFPMNLPHYNRYQLHIMAINPLERVKKLPSQIDTVIIHAKTLENIDEAIKQVKRSGFCFFIALNPETPVSIVEPYLDVLDGVLIMTVKPGQYGAKFLPEQLKKVKHIRSQSKEINIEVDGGMSDNTIEQAITAGANMIASGSFIMKSKNPETSYNKLKNYF
jgi:ribulose-phosphate 3-epimerase